jgi:hypothetical protein
VYEIIISICNRLRLEIKTEAEIMQVNTGEIASGDGYQLNLCTEYVE